MKIEEVVKKAEDLLEENFILEPPVDVYELARLNGLEIIEKKFPKEQSHISGFVTIDNGINRMYVNLNDAPSRRKFTVAHELGHWLLHSEELEKNPNRSILFRIAIGELNKDPLEKEANIFAANLLVPLKLLNKYRDNKTIEQLSELFNVSKDVIGYRLELLKRTNDVRNQKTESST
jgi:Zn-dependent peptidase ImmA (M78 family)